jgi:hypothetical protein
VSTRENTIGAVHWERLWAATDGERISLIVPAFFLQQHTPYLNAVLASRLESFFEGEVEFRLDPGDLTESQQGVNYEPGEITITGLTEPWPHGAELRKVLDDAFGEAGEIEAEQRRRAHELQTHLRRTGDS